MSKLDDAGAAAHHDDTLLAYLRRLTVAERLALNDAGMRAAIELRRAFGARRAASYKTSDR